jgi:tetratricopeptide (TPR) repeat protein
MKINFLSTCIIVSVVLSCQRPAPVETAQTDDTQLGVLNHEFTISEPSQESFEKGLLLLHSFEYEDSRAAFQEAVAADTSELMAYWGEALTHYRALWGLQDLAAGRAVLNKVGADKATRVNKADNALERSFWEAIEILYGEGELNERNKAYSDHMALLYEQYPKNQEVAAFYALGLMWSVEGGRDAVIFDRSAAVASGILAENPNHPGAMHYLIHANDDPDYAQLSKIAADQYAKVAPDATHALHMPSHIYLALGMWNEVVSSNEQSYQASINRMQRNGLDDKARGFHSYAWLHYGYLQQGRFDKAEMQLKNMLTYAERAATRGAKSYLITMQTNQKIASGQWPTDIDPMYVDYKDLGLTAKAKQHFFKALRAFDKQDAETITAEIDTVEVSTQVAELIVTDDGVALCSAGPTRYAPNKYDIVRAKVVINQMKAMNAILEKDDALTERFLIAATDLEDQSAYSSGPPDIPLPSYEQYGEWLLSKDRPEEALVQFDKSLDNAMNRAKSLQGKVKALTMLGRTAEAELITKILAGFWQQDLVAMN